MADFILHGLQQVGLCLLLSQTGDLLQGSHLLLLQFLSLGLQLGHFVHAAAQFFFLPLESFGLLIQGGFFLFQTALLLAQLGAALFDFLVVFRAGSMDLVLCFQQHFLLTVFTAADRFIDQAGSFRFSRADFPFGNLFADHDTNADANANAQSQRKNDQYNR